jgi:WD40 repeat protein/serine/threonine protein kinase
MIRISCPGCGTIYTNLKPEHIGKTARCKKCNVKFRIRPFEPETPLAHVGSETPTLFDRTIEIPTAIVESAVPKRTLASGNESPQQSIAVTTRSPSQPVSSQPSGNAGTPSTVVRQDSFTETIPAISRTEVSASETVPARASVQKAAKPLSDVATVRAPVMGTSIPAGTIQQTHPKERRAQSELPQTLPAGDIGKLKVGECAPAAATIRPMGPVAVNRGEADIAADWQVGQVILGLYEVTGILGEGGLGRVYKVRHRAWRTDLAVKTPKLDIIARPGGADDFCREAETWVNLALHPYIVSCYYVRSLGGIPRVFAEFVTGGSLSEWIRSRRLYKGSEAQIMARIIDVAVQTAWGLNYAHQQNLVHQDIKPANVLMTPQGTAKITDFGLARSKSRTGPDQQSGRTVYAQAGGYTLFYASPEQMYGGPVTRASDIWNWAASFVEMLTGEILWVAGPAVSDFFAEFTSNNDWKGVAPKPSRSLVSLINECLRSEISSRPKDFRPIIDLLTEIYRDVTGVVYPRKEPLFGVADAGTFNNRALSLLDLEKAEEAFSLWDKALHIEPHHPDATFNRALMKYRSGKISDHEFLKEVDEMLKSHPNEWKARYLFAMAQMEIEQYDTASSSLQELLEEEGHRKEIRIMAAAAKKLANRFSVIRKHHTIGVKNPTAAALSPDGRTMLFVCEEMERFIGSEAFGYAYEIFSLDTMTGTRSNLFAYPYSGAGTPPIATNGKWIAIEGSERAVVLLSDGGETIGSSGRRSQGILNISILHDGRILTVDDDSVLRLWTVKSPDLELLPDLEISRELRGHTERITCSAVSSQGRFAASGSIDGEIRFWDLTTGKSVTTCKDDQIPIFLAVQSSGARIFSANSSGEIIVWDISTGREVSRKRAHIGKITGLILTPDDNYLVTSDSDGWIKLWKSSVLNAERAFTFGSGVNQLFLSRDGHKAYALCQDRTLHVRSIARPESTYQVALSMSDIHTSESALSERDTFEGYLSKAKSNLELGGLFEAGRLVRLARAVPGFSRHPDAMQVWHSLSRLLPRKGFGGGWIKCDLKGHSGPLQALCLDSEGQRAASVGTDNKLCVWDTAQSKASWEYTGRMQNTLGIAFSTCGKYLLVCASDIHRIFSLRHKNVFAEFERMPDKSPVFSKDNLSTAFNRGRTLVIRKDQERIVKFDMPQNVFQEVRSRDGRFRFSANGSYIECENTDTGEALQSFSCDSNKVTAVDVNYRCDLVFSGDSKGIIRLFDFDAGGVIYEIPGHSEAISSAQISLDGCFALSAGLDKTLKIWELKSGTLLRTFEGHTSSVLSAALSLDATTAISAGADGLIKVWWLDWELEDRPWAEWDAGAQPYLDGYVTAHRKPPTSGTEFEDFMHILQCAGYGWLTKSGIRAKVIETSKTSGLRRQDFEDEQILKLQESEDQESSVTPVAAMKSIGDLAKNSYRNWGKIQRQLLGVLIGLVLVFGCWKLVSWWALDVRTPPEINQAQSLFSEIKPLLENKTHPDSITYGTDTALTRAATIGDLKSMKLLISSGASVNLQNSAGWTPLAAAVAKKQYDAAELLLSKGANPNGKTPERISILQLAIRGDTINGSLVELLLKKGAIIDQGAYGEAGKKHHYVINELLRRYSKTKK